MKYDAQFIKERASVIDLFRKDGHELRKMGGSFVCMCPFHQEKTASCHVHETYFHCFGCGEGGDCFKYLQLTRKVSFPEALSQLGGGSVVGLATSPLPRIEKPAVELPGPMIGKQLDAWLAGVERLKNSQDRQRAMATWRGYAPETIAWAVEQGIVGLIPFMGEWREAFLVERTEVREQRSENRISVGYHMRLGPRTAGNSGDKASWRYLPTGIGAWPFVVGDVSKAKVHFHLEGQWDALALVDIMGWHKDFPASVAIIGMRGATSWRRFGEHYSWDEDETTAFAIADADIAGNKWFAEKGFIETVQPRYRQVCGFIPSVIAGNIAIKDFNDLTKAKLVTREDLQVAFRDKMKNKIRGRRVHGPTFLQFCRQKKNESGLLGEGAKLIAEDKRRPGGRKPLPVWERYLYRCVPKDKHPAFYTAWREWLRAEAA